MWPALKNLTALDNRKKAPESAAQNGFVEKALQNYVRYIHEHPAPTAETLHEYRLACKEFRYQAELDGGAAESIVKLFKDVQDAIGEWHDWQLLLELSKKELVRRPSTLLTKIVETTAAKLTEAFRKVEEIEPQLLAAASSEPRKPMHTVRNGGRRIAQAV